MDEGASGAGAHAGLGAALGVYTLNRCFAPITCGGKSFLAQSGRRLGPIMGSDNGRHHATSSSARACRIGRLLTARRDTTSPPRPTFSADTVTTAQGSLRHTADPGRKSPPAQRVAFRGLLAWPALPPSSPISQSKLAITTCLVRVGGRRSGSSQLFECGCAACLRYPRHPLATKPDRRSFGTHSRRKAVMFGIQAHGRLSSARSRPANSLLAEVVADTARPSRREVSAAIRHAGYAKCSTASAAKWANTHTEM